MTTLPTWMVIGLVVIILVQAAGWGWTIRKSMSRALTMYEFGRTNGYEQGRLSVGPQRRAKKKGR